MIMKRYILRQFCFSIFSLFVSFSNVWAQTDASSEQNLAELPADALLVRAEQIDNALSLIHQRVSDFLKEAQENSAQLEANAIERQALSIPQQPEMVSAKAGAETVQTTLMAWDERLKQLSVLQSLLENRVVLAKKHRETALKLANEYRLVEQARQQVQPLLTLLQQRVSEQVITLEQLPSNIQAVLTAQEEAKRLTLVEAMANADTVPTSEALPESITQAAADTTAAVAQVAESAPAALNSDNATLTLSKLIDQPLAAEKRWQAEAGRDELLLTEVDNALIILKDEQLNAQKQQAAIAIILQEANYRDNLKNDFASRDLADLTALLVMQAEKWNNTDEVAKEQNQRLLDKLSALAQARQAFQDAVLPNTTDFTIEENNKALKAAKEAEKIAQITLEFRTTRQKELEELQITLADLIQHLGEQITSVDSLVSQTIELDVLAQVMITADIKLPDSIDIAYIAERLITLQQRQQVFKAELQQLNEFVAESENKLAEAKQATLEAQKNLEQRQEQLAYEERWASFLSEVELQTTPELLTTFQDTLEAYQGIQEQQQAMQIKVDISQYMLTELKTHLDELNNPMVLEQIKAEQDFTKWREGQGIRVSALVTEDNLTEKKQEQEKATQQTSATSVVETETPATTASTKAEDSASTASPASPVQTPAELTQQAIQSVRQLRDRMVSRNLLALQEQSEVITSLLAAYRVHLDNLQLQQQVLQQTLELARRAWGSATALQTRGVNEGVLDNLPPEVETWTSRELVLNLQKQIEEFKQQSQKVEQQQAILEQQQFGEGFLVALVEWEANLTRQISQLKERQEREQNYTPPDPAAMDDFEKRRYERQVKDRIEAESNWQERSLALFVSKQIEDTSKLLQAYYEKLLGLEYRHDNLQQRKEKTEVLANLTINTRDLFTMLIASLQPVVNRMEQELAINMTQVKAVLYPSQTTELLAALKEKTGITLNPNELPQLPPSVDEAAYKDAQNTLINSLLEPWAQYVAYGEWLNWLKQQQVKLGGIDTQVNQLKQTIVSLDSTQKELQQQIAKLSGFSTEDIEAMPAEEQPNTKQMRENLLLGEIGILRQERLEEMQWEASKTLIWLLVIPIIAFIAIQIMNLFSCRAIAKARRLAQKEGNPDREERAKMLSHVFGVAWKGLVILLAIVYIFKAVNIDVMPILASAGVLGLAFAFGAQQLVRDFFSGFFILLENQFRVGDGVIINGLDGNIERITPRITMVRSLGDGCLHYIPNGSISHVSNKSRELGVVRVRIPISHHANPDAVMSCLQQAFELLKADSRFNNLIFGFLNRGIENFGELAVEYSFEIRCKAGEQAELGREYRRLAKGLLEQAGIEIPSLANLNGTLPSISRHIKKP